MRLVLVMVLAGLALPLSVSAQADEERAEPSPQEPSVEPTPEEPAPSSEPTREEPALELKLDDAGVEVVPSPPRTPDGYTLEEMELRVKRAGFGLGGSALAFVVGGILVASGVSGACGWGGGAQRESCDRLAYAGTALAAGGAVGMIATGGLLAKRKRDRDSLKEARYGTPRRVQWDLARSRLVF